MKKPILLIIASVFLVTTSFSMSMAGKGENYPTVQSAIYGKLYVRSVPSEDYGTAGKTQVFRVKKDGDELLDEYPVYMRGKLYLYPSPLAGWCLVHLEPERVTRPDEMMEKSGKVSRLVFYMGGKETFTYTGEDLQKMGLEREVGTLVHRQRGQFMVHGIQQIPQTNHYVLLIEKTAEKFSGTETISLDITTGKIFGDDPGKK